MIILLIGHCKDYGFYRVPGEFSSRLPLYYIYVHMCNDMYNYMPQVYIQHYVS